MKRPKRTRLNPSWILNVLKKVQDAFYPGKNLSIDEMVVKWKGRSKYKMYNPKKPEKYHIKTFRVCDSVTGYALNLLIYFGKDTSFQEGLEGGQSEKVFEYLLRPSYRSSAVVKIGLKVEIGSVTLGPFCFHGTLFQIDVMIQFEWKEKFSRSFPNDFSSSVLCKNYYW